MTPEGKPAPKVWRLKKLLKPRSSNPGAFKKMYERQQKIKKQPEVESNYKKYWAEVPPPLRD